MLYIIFLYSYYDPLNRTHMKKPYISEGEITARNCEWKKFFESKLPQYKEERTRNPDRLS